MDRRTFLLCAALAGAGAAVSGCSGGGSGGNTGTLDFTNRLRIPPILDPAPGADGVRRYRLRAQTGSAALRPGHRAATWGYNGAFLGPTLRASRGDHVVIDVHNDLPAATTVHWHGMHLPAVMDGSPHQLISPGGTWSPHWTIDQPAATLWYHPHPHGETADQVYRGLAGLFLLDDEHTAALPLPSVYGQDDIPVVIQDKSLTASGELDDRTRPTFGLMGDTILINGTYDPYLPATTTRVRLRLLNASNARTYHVGFSDRRPCAVIATDAGLLPTPVETERVSLSPGERAEIVVDLRPGQDRVLRSFAGTADIDEDDFDLLKIRPAADLRPRPAPPSELPAAPPPEMPANPTLRRFTLNGHDAINHREMDLSRIDEVVPAGAREVWEIVNPVYAHNFHIHGATFRVLDVAGKQLEPAQRGPKDTVYLPPKSTARLAVAFGRYVDPTHPYMYHCHILRHEDAGMMGQYIVVAPGSEQLVDRQLPHRSEHQH